MGSWHLDPSEVTWSAIGGSESANRHKARNSRALSVTTHRLTLVHGPTSLEVSGEIPRGQYSRTEMQRLKAELRASLFRQLEELVARHLRVPGR